MFDHLFLHVGPAGAAAALLVMLTVPLAFVVAHAARILAPELRRSLRDPEVVVWRRRLARALGKRDCRPGGRAR
ncbi:MAG: hypothetical protein KC776_06940 [Myxococcales bacterium]|nr:hypothetical protein [Myxococcales bacterium]MCB9579166.1 hypothetical protein [Polyangiaceae bacterium]